MADMAYRSRHWWTEFLLFVCVSAVCTIVPAWLWMASQEGREVTANGWGFMVPGLVVGLWAARRYRRRHLS